MGTITSDREGASMIPSLTLKFMWTDLPLPERAARAADHGFQRVDLWDWRDEDVDGLAAVCRDRGIEIAGFFGHSTGGLVDPSQRDEVLERLSESIEVAQRVGATQLHMFSNDIQPDSIIRKPPPLTWADQFQSCIDGLRDALELVEGTDLVLGLESINTKFVPGYFWEDVGDTLSLCRIIDHPQLKLTFDCFHQQLVGGRLTDNLISSLPYVARVDVADVPGRHQPGTGEINYVHIRRVLEEHGFDGQVTFETVPVDGDSEAAVAAIKEIWPF
jgi:hydroxypyruvate isomerase